MKRKSGERKMLQKMHKYMGACESMCPFDIVLHKTQQVVLKTTLRGRQKL